MIVRSFIGRKEELDNLNSLFNKRTGSLAVVRGRRRIGKSRLIEEFARKKTFFSLTGLPPSEHVTAQSQRDEFMRQLGEKLGIGELSINDWGGIFAFLSRQVPKEKCVILLDEISWMGSKDPLFLGKLKIAWDLYFQNMPNLVLVLCGSVSSWIEQNIMKSTAFFGRVSLNITLDELSILECRELLKQMRIHGSTMELLMLLSITGGIPWYLELFDPAIPISENIKKLCFTNNGILVDEFKNIFHDLFGKRGEIYKKIVHVLANGPAQHSEISEKLEYSDSGSLSNYLDELIVSGFVKRDFTWSLTSGKPSRFSLYRLRDNYLRFYLKYIEPNVEKINLGHFKVSSLTVLPGLESMMGFQFENLVLNNRHLLYKSIGINPMDIVFDNPFFQRPTERQKGCQIDYLIQTKFGTLYVCEIKFSKNPIGMTTVHEVEEKINRLKYPKGISCQPVLIHVSGVTDELIESDFFAHRIDFGDFLMDEARK